MRLITCLLVLVIIFISGCRTSDNVVSGRFIQKRKYTHGWHVERASNDKLPAQTAIEDTPAAATSPAAQTNTPESANGIDASISADADEVLAPVTKPNKASPKKSIQTSKSTTVSDESDASLAPQEIQKKKKAKLHPSILWGWNCVAIGSWFQGWWGSLSVLNIPAIAIGCSLLGVILIIHGLRNIKKSKSKKQNIVLGVAGIILGLVLVILSLAAL